jgi:phosphoglycerate dehydrogenase-like enzyme
MPALKIWTNALLDQPGYRKLREGTREHQLIVADALPDVLTKGEPDPQLSTADVAFGQPDPDGILASPTLKWIHLSSAGYARYDTPELRSAMCARGVPVTNSSWLFAEPCAQHLLAFLLADSRQLYPAFSVQRTDRTWPQNALRETCRLLEGQKVLIVGFGAIGRRLAELLAPFRAEPFGFRRSPEDHSPIPVFGLSELDTYLSEADHVINILPDNESTRYFFNWKRFGQVRRGARYYSIGRGTTTDQEALLAVLESGRIGGAYLDVTDPEPLPPDHPLWTARNCYITPHIGGGHADEFVRSAEHFLSNLKRFEQGQPLWDRIY